MSSPAVKVFDYGRFECDTGLAYRSAIAYGRIRKSRFFDALLAKYGTGVYAIAVEQWPALDRTKSPNARP